MAQDEERRRDYFRNIAGMARAATHFAIESENGLFDDARFHLRKIMEYSAICAIIGYEDDLYKQYTEEVFVQRGKGFGFLLGEIIKSKNIPEVDKQLFMWIRGDIGPEKGTNQYWKISEETIHVLSKESTIKHELPDGSFKMDISEIKEERLKKKMEEVAILLLNATGLTMGVFKYNAFIRSTGITPEAEKLKADHERLQGIVQNLENKLLTSTD